MPHINAGACIGVYYWQGEQIQVHNGRLLRARYGNNWRSFVDTTEIPDEVEIRHWNIDRSLGIMFLETRSIRDVIQVNRTPDLHQGDPNYCARFRPPQSGNRIRPGACIGVRFIRPNGQMDVKNGRYLYWLDNNGDRHCVLREGQAPFAIVYMHWVVKRNRQGQITGLIAEPIMRTRVQEVRRTTL